MASKSTSLKNSLIYYDYYSRLKNIALSVFEWENLPSTCNARFLEECLFNFGNAIFVNDKEMSFLNLKVIPKQEFNVYEEHLYYTAHSFNYNKDYHKDECVYIRNNYLSRATDETIIIFAERLARIQRAINGNINAQKTPLLIRTEERTKTSLINVYKQYNDDEPIILASKSLTDKPIEVLKTDAPFVADKLREEKTAVWNEALEFLGVNTNPSDKKKERLIVNEVDANNEQIEIQKDVMLLARQEACEQINKMFGLNVSVKRRIEKENKSLQENKNESLIEGGVA